MTSRLARLTGGLAGAAVLIALLTALARVAGFGRTFVFSQTVTTSCLSQAYFLANQIPNVVFEIVAGGALASMVVPVLAGPVERGDREHVRHVASAMLTWVVLVLVPLSIVLAVAAGPVMDLLVHGQAGRCEADEVVGVASRMLVVFAPQIVLYGLAVVLYGVLQAHRRFTGPAVAPLVSSLVVIGAYLAYVIVGTGRPNDLANLPQSAELTLSIGTTLGVVALVGTAMLAVRPLRLGLRPTLTFPPGAARRISHLALAGVATVVAQQLATLTVMALSGRDTAGALAHYNYAWAVFLLPWAILAVPIATSAFPVLSARADEPEFDRITASTTRAVVLVSCAGAAALAAVAIPVAHLFDRAPGTYPDALAHAILAFAPGLLGYGLVAHLGRVLFAGRRGRASAGATVAGWLVVIAADLALALTVPRDWVVPALGLGNTIGMTVAGAALVIALIRARGRTAVAGLGRAMTAGVVGGTAGGLAGYGVAWGIGPGGLVTNMGVGALAAAAAAAVFAAIALVIDGRDLRAVLSRKVTRDG
ncbi:murein biosynthesis integral membrane protein MurJ [Actinomadura sp. HBU206391]|uniref:murein biosynthesis integral membrane protein MurJ n=1 Tax=Actinomadura sp. HBU206391 TaxID=2731692 RepID=UPI002905D514|nr:lipid II flippase MurJ [Actinomadura sp. HBU206391]